MQISHDLIFEESSFFPFVGHPHPLNQPTLHMYTSILDIANATSTRSSNNQNLPNRSNEATSQSAPPTYVTIP
jgi:hypothetical protein